MAAVDSGATRRQLLRGVGVAGATLAVAPGAAMAQQATETPGDPEGREDGEEFVGSEAGAAAVQEMRERIEIDFSRTVNAVDDLGLDPTGQEPIDGDIDRALSPGTLVEFPPGEYLVRSPIAPRHDNVGIRGLGESRHDVQFRIAKGRVLTLFQFSGGNGLVLENFTVNQLDDWETEAGMAGYVEDNIIVREVEFVGRNPTRTSAFSWGIRQEGGSGLVDGYYRLGPSIIRDYASGGRGEADGSKLTIYNGAANFGDIVYRNVNLANTSESGMYCGKSTGTIRVYDSYFRNCVHSAIRVAGEGSRIHNCMILMDYEQLMAENEISEASFPGAPQPQLFRGIWPQSHTYERAGPLITQCDILVRNNPRGVGAIYTSSRTGGPTIRNCRIQNDSRNMPSIRAQAVRSGAARPYEVVIEGCSLTGSSRGRAVDISGRAGSVIRESCIKMPNSAGVVGAAVESLMDNCVAPQIRGPGSGILGGLAGAVVMTVLIAFGGFFGILLAIAIFVYMVYRAVTL